jgi:hypothetical protein
MGKPSSLLVFRLFFGTGTVWTVRTGTNTIRANTAITGGSQRAPGQDEGKQHQNDDQFFHYLSSNHPRKLIEQHFALLHDILGESIRKSEEVSFFYRTFNPMNVRLCPTKIKMEGRAGGELVMFKLLVELFYQSVFQGIIGEGSIILQAHLT